MNRIKFIKLAITSGMMLPLLSLTTNDYGIKCHGKRKDGGKCQYKTEHASGKCHHHRG